MNRREVNNRDPRRGLPSLAERRKTNIPSAVNSETAIEPSSAESGTGASLQLNTR